MRHRSHALTIGAVAEIVEHGEEPLFDKRVREGLLSGRRVARVPFYIVNSIIRQPIAQYQASHKLFFPLG
jgi:hypothetical protein